MAAGRETEAKKILTGVLRTALLFGGTVVDNQYREGIFFVAMPPERLGWHLGLDPGAPLPNPSAAAADRPRRCDGAVAVVVDG